MSTHTYSIDPSTLRGFMSRLVEAGFSKEHDVILDDGAGEITINFWTDLTADQAAVLDAVMGSYSGELYVEQQLKKDQIDVRTRELLARGFQHDGHVFSLSLAAQANWNRLSTKYNADRLTFPCTVSTYYGAEHTFVEAADFEDFEDAYMAALDSVIDAGRVLKVQVDAATTVAAVLAIEDTRT